MALSAPDRFWPQVPDIVVPLPRDCLAVPAHVVLNQAANAGCRWVLMKEGEEAPSMPSRQNADSNGLAVLRGSSYGSQLDMAMGPSGEGNRLQELVGPFSMPVLCASGGK